jgi:TorA maturation chaperone TorD
MPTDTSLTTAEIALARHHTYMLLSRLYLEGLTTELLPYVQALPALAATLPLVANNFDADEAAADHHDLFSFNLFPYQSIFLDPAGLLGGSLSESVADDYRQAGFRVLEAEPADHIGHQLAFLGFLSGAEADAWEDKLLPIAFRMQQLATDFLQKQLLRWLPPLIIALQRQPHAFYARLADLTLELLYSHLSARGDLVTLGGGSETATAVNSFPPLAQESPSRLFDTGMKEIASYLISPPMSGIYLSRHDISQLGRQQRLPRGFGSRKQMLTNLLRVGEQYDQTPTLLRAWQDLLKGWQEAYTTMQMTYPSFSPFVETWLARTRHTSELLQEMRLAGMPDEQNIK